MLPKCQGTENKNKELNQTLNYMFLVDLNIRSNDKKDITMINKQQGKIPNELNVEIAFSWGSLARWKIWEDIGLLK